jgi:penicillin-binding protein 2
MASLFQEFGLGTGASEDFPYRKKGLIPTKSWKSEHKHARWTISDTIQASIGQGYMLATPLELALALARLVSGKKLLTHFEKEKNTSFSDMPYDRKHLDIILHGLDMTVNAPGSTAFSGRIPFEGMEMGGKTGTSQVCRITAAQRASGQTKTHSLDWGRREHGLFIGYAPVQNPRFAVVVVVEHSSGSSPAVQTARDILIKAQLLEKEKNYVH